VSSTTFTYDLDDLHFVLFDQLKMHERLGKTEAFRDLDRDVYAATVREAERMAREVLSPINGPGDLEGCHVDEAGNVTLPKGYKEAWNLFREGAWVGPRADPELGGAGMPATIGAVLNELFSGASIAFTMYAGLTAAAARVILGHAPEAMRRPVATKLFSGDWGGTMCLTEAGAGSSVGDNGCKATPTEEEDVYLLEGEKIFITGGDQDLTDNIVHMVLARTPGSPEGTRGLSLFMVPKYDFDEKLELGERNAARVLSIEHKMGLKGSATCVLGFGLDGPCKGWLIGKEHEGITLMFEMMNEARIGVGVQGLAAGSAAYQYSCHYANERIQGTRLSQMRDPKAEKVAIVEHADVRRMLMTQKVFVETMRAMTMRLALEFDLSETIADEKERERLAGRVDLLVPVVKSMCTDLGFELAVLGVQIFGGYGYTAEFPIEQLVRDAKIQSIYEGTNGIQALDLLGRKMRVGGGKLFMAWMQETQADLEAAKAEGFGNEAAAIGKAVQAVAASAMHIAGVGQKGEIDGAMLYATPFLRAMGLTVLASEALDQARVARKAISEAGETDLRVGKLLNLEFYLAQLLPQVVGLAKSVQSGDVSCLDPRLFRV
jgi:alkylation response protein AidB-like acyl-CoA dehydrogenase